MGQDTELKMKTKFGEVNISVSQDGAVILFGEGIRRIHAIQPFEYRGENDFDLFSKATPGTPGSDSLWFGIDLHGDKVKCKLNRGGTKQNRWGWGEAPTISAIIMPCQIRNERPHIKAYASVGASPEKRLEARPLLLDEPDAKKAA